MKDYQSASAIFIILLIFLFRPTFSQQAFLPENKLQVGIKGGLNLAHLYLDRFNDRSSRQGIQAGIYSKIPIGTFFSFQPELLFSPKGVRIERAGPLSLPGGMIRLDYIELPVMLNLDLGSIVDVYGGFYTARLVGEQVTYPFSRNENFRNQDYGFLAGFSFEFNPVVIGMRYSQGFIPVAQNENAERLTGQAVNSVIHFYVAYIFKIPGT